jgi:gluconokinase
MKQHPVIYIMGVSGSGKSTIGKKLSRLTGIPFFDADDFHSSANKEKMRAGIALNDDDREGWLQAINKVAIEQSGAAGAIIACSALKSRYRALLTNGVRGPIHWIFLQGDYSLISARMKARQGHYMPESLLLSQFETLEPPADAITIDVAEDPDAIVQELSGKLQLSAKA